MAEWTLKEKSSGELTVTVDGEEWKKAVNKAFNKIAGSVTIEGFRKGHAPRSILEKRIPAAQAQYQAVDDNANEWLQKGLEETKVNPISRPTLDVKSIDDNSAVLVFAFQVMPEITLGQYTGLKYDLGDTSVSDEEFNKEIDRMRENYADLETKDGEAEKGDTVNINYVGTKDGVEFEGGKADNYNLELGSGSFIPGFEDQLIGSRAGDVKDLSLTFPEDYHAEELKGAAVVFHVTVNEVKHKVLPELDDDFAKDINAKGVETAEDLKKMVRTRLEESKKADAENKADEELMKQLRDNTAIEIPDAMIEDEEENLVNQLKQQISQYGMKFDQYLKMTGQSEQQIKDASKDEAEANVKIRLILNKIAQTEKLEPSDEDFEKEYKDIAAAYGMEVDKVKMLLSKDTLEYNLQNQKAFDFVKEHAEGYKPAEEPAAAEETKSAESAE